MRWLGNFWRRLGGRLDPSDRRALQNLLTPAEFARLLQRERSRSDRTGDAFSLLMYSVPHGQDATATLSPLARILRGRLRLTDDAGWIDGRRVGVLLPITAAAGAWKVADDVAQRFPHDVPAPDCEVYSYPSHWWPGEKPDPDDAGRRVADARPVHALEVLFVRRVPAWKSAVDVLAAGTALIVLAPLLAAIAVAVKCSSPGPVFFVQQRSGRGGRRFRMYKFRTMYDGAHAAQQALRAINEQDGPAFKIRRDPRVTRLGRFLRRTGLDELPQLWNVLRRDMSVVGPRPLPCDEARACSRWQLRRLDVIPGLTCIWQVQRQMHTSFADWIRMDIAYVRSQSLIQDLALILRTMPAVLFGRGC